MLMFYLVSNFYFFNYQIVTYNNPCLKIDKIEDNNKFLSNSNNNTPLNLTNSNINVIHNSNNFQGHNTKIFFNPGSNINQSNYISKLYNNLSDNNYAYNDTPNVNNNFYDTSNTNSCSVTDLNDIFIENKIQTPININHDFSPLKVSNKESGSIECFYCDSNNNNLFTSLSHTNSTPSSTLSVLVDKNYEESYINASCLDGGPLERDKGMFIATQGPLKKTIKKFWKLAFQKGVTTIIMLCQEEEDMRVSKI